VTPRHQGNQSTRSTAEEKIMENHEANGTRASSHLQSEPTMHSIMNRVRAAHAERIWPEISAPTPQQRASMLHEVDCPGLTAHDLGDAFAEEFQGRRLWCRQHCEGTFTVEPVWSDGDYRRDTGRRFLFADEADAALFRLTCC
jgi:hypothetical protein